MKPENVLELVNEALADVKANDVIAIDVRKKINVTDIMVVASGTSDRHVQALANSVVETAKKKGVSIIGVERDRAWVLIDLYDVVVHIMLPETREFYELEKLWQVDRSAELSTPA